MELDEIKKQVTSVITELLDAHPQKEDSIIVIGCSSSEVCGGIIAKK